MAFSNLFAALRPLLRKSDVVKEDGVVAYKFVLSPSALRFDAKENLGFCAESEPDVDWNACAADNGDGTLDLSRCLDSDNYTHTCYDAVWDSTR